jgi:hypothetical protein
MPLKRNEAEDLVVKYGWKKALFLTAALALGLPLGCGDEEAASGRKSQRGESCEAHIDCEAGLACVGSVCSVGSFGLHPTGKECVQIECRVPEDCCPEPTSTCEFYDEQCQLGILSYCDSFALSCVCDATQWACEEDQCVAACDNTGAQCTNALGLWCNGSRCVECLNDTDCLTEQVCIQNECVIQCEHNDDCAIFHTCQGGACIETGCNSSRECVAFTDNTLAVCDGAKKCQIPCSTDLECDNPNNYGYMACSGGFCVDIGCETNEECRALLNVQAGANFEAECRVIQAEGS